MGHGEEVAQQSNYGLTTMDCLPDDLLIKILSFLPMKKAALTSLLSKRWRTLFAFTHNFDFDEPIFWHDVWDIRKRIPDFVHRTLALQGGNQIRKLSLRLKEKFNSGGLIGVNRWVHYALKHGVFELHLCIDKYTPFLSRVFTSTTLLKLSLGRGFYMYRFPPNISLPALKVLLLDSIWIKGYNSYNRDDFDILLNTPNVVDLYYSDYVQQKYLHCTLDSLAKATLDLHYSLKKQVDVTDFISGIHNVKTLHLTFSAVEVVSVWCKGGLLVFKNLADLLFSSKNQDGKVLFPLILDRASNLQNLVLLGLYRYTFRQHQFVGIRPNNQIKTLSIMQCRGSENEMKHISHFLLIMECLEVVKVYVAYSMDDPTKRQLTEDLMKLPTASSKLKIQVI